MAGAIREVLFHKKLLKMLIGRGAGTNDKKYESCAYLVQPLDSRSILMLTNDCNGDGSKDGLATAGPLQQHRNTEFDECIEEVRNPAIEAHGEPS